MGEYRDAAWYDQSYAADPHPHGMTKLHKYCAKLLKNASPDSWPETILDLGCGPGWFEQELRRAGFKGHYTGIEFSRWCADQAVAVVNPVKSVIIHGDLRSVNPDFPALVRANPMITCLETLEHLEDDQATLALFASPGRRVLLSVPTYDSDAHVRWFDRKDDLPDRYKIDGYQWEEDRQIYVLGRFR